MKTILNKLILISLVALTTTFVACAQTPTKETKVEKSLEQLKIKKKMNWNPLTAEETRVIVNKGTEYAGTGKYEHNNEKGTYVCKRCNAPLYRSESKFDAHCGWPSFDDEIKGAIKRHTDADGMRTEIVCANCAAHLGHVFTGERFTSKDTRHCVNSISMNFVPDKK